MGMQKIRLSKDQLLSEANRVSKLREDYDNIINQLGSIIRSMSANDTWQGRSQQAMETKYDEMQTSFRQFSEMMEEYCTDMRRVANEMEDEDADLARFIESRFFI